VYQFFADFLVIGHLYRYCFLCILYIYSSGMALFWQSDCWLSVNISATFILKLMVQFVVIK